MTTIERVRAAFQECFGSERLERFGDDAIPFTVFPDHARGADLDSLDHVEFVMALEDAFPGLRIPDDAAENITTLATAAALVEELLAEAAAC